MTDLVRFNPLEYPACLQEPERLTDINSWHEHIPFAFALVQMLRPKVIVELGTHKGDSYCAFCQAVDALGLDTACFAVDTWQGDAHAGEYDHTVFEELRDYHDRRYRRFSSLIKCNFDEALAHFPDASIDLLHIDGLHTYESVAQDFESWLPKLSKRGIVLLHDTNVRERDFGVWRLWDELKDRYPSCEFKHGHGLGILAVGEEVPEAFQVLFADKDDFVVVSRFFSRLGGQTAMIKLKDQQIANLRVDHERALERLGQREGQLGDMDRRIELLQEQLTRTQADQHRALHQLRQQEEQLRQQADRLRQQEEQLRQQADQLRRQEERLSEKTQQLRQTQHQFDLVWTHLQALRQTRTVRFSCAISAAADRLLSQLKTPARAATALLNGPIEGVVDLPAQGSGAVGALFVAGWALSTAGAVTKVEVLADSTGAALGSLRCGLPRPDVVKARPWQKELNCGYAGTVDIRSLPAGPTRLRVRITDAHGNRRDLLRSIVVGPGIDNSSGTAEAPSAAPPTQKTHTLHKPAAEIEHVAWRGRTLEVEGWALWPTSSYPRQAHFYLDDRLVGETPVNLSRPDIARRFGGLPIAYRCGFRFRQSPVDPSDTTNKRCKLSVVFTEGQGGEINRSVDVVHEGSLLGSKAVEEEVVREFERVLAEFQSTFERHPAVLDWNTGLELASSCPQYTIFPPPGDDPILPYIDHSIDIVAISSADAARAAEARRVAEAAVVTFARGEAPKDTTSDTSASAERTRNLQVEWLSNERRASVPTVSIIIPVHNQIANTEACLSALRTTLPADFEGEIIIVDDGSVDDTPVVLDRWATSDERIRVLRNPKNLGFIDSCNRGAEAASGEILVFLNNDTLPQPGWLPALLQTFRDYPDAGAVGGKLLYPDGRLQEAGGVIFSDGSGANFGKYDEEADAPLYNHVREVDYCSGALLATKSSLFREIRGFDTRYRPAYFEDADYCFSVREKGYRVYYQPESRVVHLEGGTAGTDLDSGIKHYQVLNRPSFVQKWSNVLRSQPAPPDRYDFATLQALVVRGERSEGDKKSTKRVLYCAPNVPEYDRESGAKTIFDFITLLRDQGWAVTFLARDGTGGEHYARKLRQQGVATYAGTESRMVGDDYLVDVNRLIRDGHFDLAIFSFWYIAEQYMPVVRSLSPVTRVIVDSMDLHFLRNARRILGPTADAGSCSALDLDYACEMMRELNTYAAADGVLARSQKEANLINDFAGDPTLAHVAGDYEECEPSTIPFPERKGILFIGNFRHPPNVEAAEYLCREIAPRIDPAILAKHPIYVVGNALDEKIRRYASELRHVRMVGWVPLVLPYLQRARISIVPLLHGAGTKRKLLQALMVGTPSVSTSVGVEGFDLQDGEHVLVADDPGAFADAMVRLLEDEEMWQRLAQQGQAFINERHSREAIRRQFMSAISAVLAREPKRPRLGER